MRLEKICLINPPHEESLDSCLDPPLGLMYIAEMFRQRGYDVCIIDLSFHINDDWEEVIPLADLYGITVMTPSIHHAIKIKDIVKNINPDCKIMVGGAHPSSLPAETLNMGFDIVIVGEAESIIDNILQCEPPVILHSKPIRINSIPFPARDLVPIVKYTRKVDNEKAFSIIASRGCPYQCIFCVNSVHGQIPKFRSVPSVIDEIKHCISSYGIKTFIFYDDTFTINPNIDFLLSEIKKLNIKFRCNGNSRKDTYELFKKLYDAGCREIDFGIESGSQKILNLINKKSTVSTNKLVIYNAKKAGLNVKTFLMVGSPGETWDTVNETLNFIKETQPQLWTLFTFVPLPGCAIWNSPDKYGIKIITKDYKQYFNIAGNNIGGITCETDSMTANDIIKARQYLIDNLPKQIGPLQNYYTKL